MTAFRLARALDAGLTIRRAGVSAFSRRTTDAEALPEANRYCRSQGCKIRLKFKWQRHCFECQQRRVAEERVRWNARAISTLVSDETKAALVRAARERGLSLSVFVGRVLEALVELQGRAGGKA